MNLPAPKQGVSATARNDEKYQVAIRLDELDDIARANETVTVGVPFPESTVYRTSDLSFQDGAGKPCQYFHISEVTHWPDQSLKWVRGYLAANVASGGSSTVTLVTAEAAQTVAETAINPAGITARNDRHADGEPQTELQLETSSYRLTARLADEGFELLTGSGAPLASISLQCQLAAAPADSAAGYSETVKTTEGGVLDEHPEAPQTLVIKQIRLLDKNPVFTKVALDYECVPIGATSGVALAIEQLLTVHHHNGALQQSITVHNPSAAQHLGGFWDMGTVGSVWIEKFDVVCALNECSAGQLELQAGVPNTEVPIARDSAFELYQESSGGQNWQSRVHVNHANEVRLDFCGYKLDVAGKESHAGKRAEPIVYFEGNGGADGADSSGIGFYYDNFWQAFPSLLAVDSGRVTFGLLPGQFPGVHELQGGEKLQKEIWSMCTDSLQNLQWLRSPLIPVVSEQHWQTASQLHFFDRRDHQAQENPLANLIKPALDEANGFFAKRETFDEYGWRNFGELFADHESWVLDDGYHVSHYNNQYDPIYSFGLQFLLTGDKRWFQLMDELARHVVTIDLYNTLEDREDFCGAPFWHTDHYMDAFNSSHRTHSTYQRQSVGKQVGGCFSVQHCYTGGLALHYLLTGFRASREAVFAITKFSLLMENGPDTVIGTLQSVVGRELRIIRELRSGDGSLGYAHLLNRGTGNVIMCLINAYELSGETHWLHKAEETIRGTIHPLDDISKRDLGDVEHRWSYAVFLFALTRYLSVKEQEHALDQPYWYARETFVRYMRWVLENEVPYLHTSSELEQVNATWPAQDSRKSYLLQQAAFYDAENEASYLQKSDEIMAHIQQELEDSDQLSYTRVQVLLLQSFCRSKCVENESVRDATHEYELGDPPAPTVKGELVNIARRLLKALAKLSPTREYRWLKYQYKLNR